MSVPQTVFHDALLDSNRAVPDGLSDGQGRPAGRRFSVYRNNVASSLTDALEVSFPAIAKLVGEENFKKVAGVFLRQHPPQTPVLMMYGKEFPAFFEGFEPLKHIGYLPDVARLEQAIRESYHAADAAQADASILETLSPEALSSARFSLSPATQVIRSKWPIHAIWAFNMENGPKPEPGAQCVLITRSEFDPDPNPITSGTAEFIEALNGGATLSFANDRALSAEPDFDLSQALALLLGHRAITDIQIGDD